MQLKTILLSATLMVSPLTLATNAAAQAIPGVKNVIVIINDGAGPTVYDAARLYLGRPLVTDGAAFKKIHISTYPLREDRFPNSIYSSDPSFDANGVLLDNNQPIKLDQQEAVVYTSARFWDTTPVAGRDLSQPGNPTGSIAGGSFATGYQSYPAGFLGYEWSRYAHPDSGNTASSLASGNRSYNNSINVDGVGTPQVTITDLIDAAKAVGKTTGVVATVQFADATPAALGGAHNIFRGNGPAISAEMFSTGRLDVIGGTGNPDFDDNGNPLTTPNYRWISPTHWADLKAGSNTSGLNALKWKLLQNKADIEALADKKVKPPVRVAMIMKSNNSTQYNRSGVSTNPTLHEPFVPGTTLPACFPAPATPVPCAQPFQPNVPSQVKLTVAALNVLGSQGKGFYLMSEAGAVDRAEHGNSTGRMLEEQIDSYNTVQAVIDGVNRADTAATWDNTLLIITADHDHLLYGPDGATIPFQPLVDKGAGKVPGNRWFGPNHGTGLVPLYAYGKGSAEIAALATMNDSYTDGQGRTFGNGAYTEQTVIGKVLKDTLSQAN